MMRVQTKYNGDTLLFIRQDGRTVDHASDFQYNGREYYFLGGFYYDLEPSLIDYIFGE